MEVKMKMTQLEVSQVLVMGTMSTAVYVCTTCIYVYTINLNAYCKLSLNKFLKKKKL